MLLYKLGRALQVVGLIITPFGLVGNVIDPNRVDVKTSLMIAGAGVVIFLTGWLLQQSGRPR
jgi:hypothetical protein